MNTSQRAPATAKVDGFLVQEKQRGGNPERIKIIDRLLAYGDTLESAWAEILEKSAKIHPYGSTWLAWQFVVNELLFVATYKNLEAARRQYQAEKEVAEINREIAELAAKLARKMRHRKSLHPQYNITLPDDNDLVLMMARAAEFGHDDHVRHNFKQWVKPDLDRLSHRFDWKYWPDMPDMLDALAAAQGDDEMGFIDPAPRDAIGAALTASDERSTRDFYRALDTALDQLNKHSQTGIIGAELTADNYADLCNALLGLDAVITPKAIKTYRNQERKRVAQQAGTTDA